MKAHGFLEQGLTVLEARLRNPTQPGSGAVVSEVRPFVTIGRETGAGATTVGELLVPLLNEAFGEPGQGWVLLDKDLVARALAKKNLPERLAAFLPEDKISEIKGWIGELVGLHPSLWQLEHQVVHAILQLAHLGRVILIGRATPLLTQSVPGGFHVRLVASLETRVQRVMALRQCTAAEAQAHIKESDLARQRYVRAQFGRKLDDALIYDLVINTERLQATTAAQLIVTAMRARIAVLARPTTPPPVPFAAGI